MNRLLLDTHVWLRYLLGDRKLAARHKVLIESDAVEVWLSPISIWEAQMLIENGRIQVGLPVQEWVNRALQTMQVREAPLTFRIAQRFRRLNLKHRDPADRFLAATAAEMDLTLLTDDERLLKCRDFATA